MNPINPFLARLAHQKQKLTKGSFGHNVILMFVGTAIGQMGAVLAAPILTRLYTPDMFGVQGGFTAILVIVSVIAALRFEMAIPLATTQRDVASVIALCGVTIIGTTLIFTALLWWLTPERFMWADMGKLEPYRWYLPFGFVAIGIYQIMIYVATQQHDFKAIAQTKIYQGVASPVSQIAMGMAEWGTVGLIIGFIIGQSMGITQLIWRLILKKRELMRGVSWASIKLMATRYRNFPLYSSWSGLVNSAGSGMLLAVMLPVLYSATVAGYVFLTDRIIGRPLTMISTSILQVYIGEASRSVTADPDALRRRFRQLAIMQTGIVSVWLVAVNAVAGWVFPIAFGAEWAAAVPYLRVLSIALLPSLVVHALAHTLQVLQKQRASALWEVGRFMVVAGALWLGVTWHYSALETLLLYSICQAVAQVVLLFIMYRSLRSL